MLYFRRKCPSHEQVFATLDRLANTCSWEGRPVPVRESVSSRTRLESKSSFFGGESFSQSRWSVFVGSLCKNCKPPVE